ncbi:hypothetical protein [Stenotrophomonas muris]|uniref:hypothetical protein n=1 Tax=Stenotrophomonas muris TaxID=2963283 RepID=UPI0039C73DE7
MDWTLMQWLEAGGYVVAIGGGLFGCAAFVWKLVGKYGSFRYPSTAEEGVNILHPTVSSVKLGELVGMSAVVPEASELLVKLSKKAQPEYSDSGPGRIPPTSGLGSMAAWFYRTAPAPLNWRGREYQKGTDLFGPTQNFVARGGPAELAIHFERLGEVVISVYERGNPEPTWTKTIEVLPNGRDVDHHPN